MTRKAPPPRVPARSAPPSRAPAAPRRPAATRPPLVEAHVLGPAVGDEADPEQDIAPNLGGESQMQDA